MTHRQLVLIVQFSNAFLTMMEVSYRPLEPLNSELGGRQHFHNSNDDVLQDCQLKQVRFNVVVSFFLLVTCSWKKKLEENNTSYRSSRGPGSKNITFGLGHGIMRLMLAALGFDLILDWRSRFIVVVESLIANI